MSIPAPLASSKPRDVNVKHVLKTVTNAIIHLHVRNAKLDSISTMEPALLNVQLLPIQTLKTSCVKVPLY